MQSCNIANSIVLLVGTLAAAASTSQRTPQALPSVHDVQGRFVAALGGRGAVMRHQSMTVRGYYDVYRANGRVSRVSFVRYLAEFKLLEVDTGRHVSRSGYNDGVAWGINPYPEASPQIARGDFLKSARRDADMYYLAHISDYFRWQRVMGIEGFAGHNCYQIRGVTKWGNQNDHNFDTQTGLLVGYAFRQWNATNTGRERTMTIQVFDDYRDFDGLLIPMRITTTDGGKLILREQDTSVQFDDVDDRVFSLPASVITAIRDNA